MSLPVDYKIDKIIKEIQKELKEEGKEVSYDTILKCVNQQIYSTMSGMERGDTIMWKYFGTFVATKKRVDGLNKTYAKIGKNPTLQDNGLIRLSFNRQGELVNETEFVGQRKDDYKNLI